MVGAVGHCTLKSMAWTNYNFSLTTGVQPFRKVKSNLVIVRNGETLKMKVIWVTNF